MENNNYSNYSFGTVKENSAVATNKAIAGSFLWMFVGALITLVVGIASTSIVANMMFANPFTLLFIFIGCFIVQMILTARIHKNTYVTQNFSKSLVSFILYSALTGFTFSFIFAYFDVAVLNQVFAGVAAYFLLLAGLTFIFRKKIIKAASFAYMGLIVLLIVSTIMLLVSMFAFNGIYFDALYLGISILGVLVFSVITMVDIKRAHEALSYTDNKKCMMIGFAFDLYLDFMNIFIYILRILLILGKNVSRRD